MAARLATEMSDELRQGAEYALVDIIMQQLVGSTGIAESTLCEKEIEFPETMGAVERGQSEETYSSKQALFKRAINGDADAVMLYLKQYAGWTD